MGGCADNWATLFSLQSKGQQLDIHTSYYRYIDSLKWFMTLYWWFEPDSRPQRAIFHTVSSQSVQPSFQPALSATQVFFVKLLSKRFS